VPFTLAMIGLLEQEDLWLMSNVVGCDPKDVTIGMPVRVVFEQVDDVWLPLFAPSASTVTR
jgi:uncharacterized OB-fold protein